MPTGPAIAQSDSSDSVIPAGPPNERATGVHRTRRGRGVTCVLSDGGFKKLNMSPSGSALVSHAVSDWICELPLPLLPHRKRFYVSASIEA